ncbi:cardiolipin synthase ClsB [Malikia sp.]|uniref:cardiolipin synthase ClsB n=1 Tax=Malikia sp. TaxID=2070706 RepID=UPI00262665B1|nr:cardiolipin synthase ClsB [Malikia sp.]MDD2729158.1 cardiolipin synthase ClsB [Malikia sp.]
MKTPLRGGHQLHLLEGGAELFPAMVQAMERAQQLVHIETYIFEFAGSTLQVAEAMERAARRGITVRLVVDGIGTARLPRTWRERLERAGVQCRIYRPLGHLGLLIPSRWRRLHRKLCVVDGALGFCGGINLIDDLDDVSLGRLEQPRLDFALQVSGPLVADMLESMEQLWWRMQALNRARQHEFRAAWQALRAGLPTLPTGPVPRGRKAQPAALLLRDNLRHRHDIERAYLKAIAQARREIVIANAYFIPGRRLRRALTLAAARGVRVRLLLHARYEHFLQYHAARTVYQWLLDAGIEIHEYAPSALHAKVAVVDGRWATVGSTNLDPLSLLLAREANVVTRDPAFARGLWQRLDHLMRTAGQRVAPEQLLQRPWRQRLFDRVAFGVMRGMLFLLGQRY